MLLVTSDFIAALSFKSLSLDFIIYEVAILSVPPLFHLSPPLPGSTLTPPPLLCTPEALSGLQQWAPPQSASS